jgi:hypothetical protein
MEGNKAMSDIYLAKSDLTGAIYAVNGKSKTNVTEFVVGLIAKETASLRQRVLDLEAENAGLIAGLKQAEGYVMGTREALALRDCVECGICAFEVSPVDSSQGFCWNCQKFLTIKLAEKILNGGDDE